MMMVKKKKNRGFTVLEVLLGISIFSIIALTAYSVFSAGIRLNKKAENQGKTLRETRWALELMSKEIENMVSYDYSSTYEEKTALEGESKKISFLSATPDGLKVVKYYLVSANDENIHTVLRGNTYSKNVSVLLKEEMGSNSEILVREENGFTESINGNVENSVIEILLKNAKSDGLKFYYSYLEGMLSDEIAWKKSWKENYIPSMVRVEIELVSPGNQKKDIALTKDIFIPTGFARVYQEK